MLNFGFYNEDCLPRMKEYPDKFFDLAIVDPPYGSGLTEGGDAKDGSRNTAKRFGGMFAKSISGQTTRPHGAPKQTDPRQIRWTVQPIQETSRRMESTVFLADPSSTNSRGGGVHRAEYGGGNRHDYRRDHEDATGKKIIAWDVAPEREYFDELFRISRNQIIWGGNYFDLPPTRCFVVFRKTNIPLKGFTMSPVEYAWTSFNRNACMIEAFTQGTQKEPRFHPTQKPI